MSADLKKRGFRFVGPTICYAHMQATGMVNDHTVDCFRYQELRPGYALSGGRHEHRGTLETAQASRSRSRAPLAPVELERMNAYWRAANYLSVGQIYLKDNPLLRAAARLGRHQGPAARPLGHLPGSEPRLRAPQPGHQSPRPRRHLCVRSRARRPGHGGQRLPRGHVQRVLQPDLRRTKLGMQRLFKQFSFPGGIPSHVAPETPGSINEGGELGYSLAHAYGAAFDNPGPRSSSASSATARPRPARSRPAGSPTSS